MSVFNFQQFESDDAIIAGGQGPLSDGIRFDFSEEILRLSFLADPFDLVIYFTADTSVSSSGSTDAAQNPTGIFPGLNGQDFLRFDDLKVENVTLAHPGISGIVVQAGGGSFVAGGINTADIAAIQIRGQFFNPVPEPSAMTLCILVAFACGIRQPQSIL